MLAVLHHRREPADLGAGGLRDHAGREPLQLREQHRVEAANPAFFTTSATDFAPHPQDADLALARLFAGTAALAIERHHSEQARLAAEARARSAHDELAKAMRAEREL